MAGHNVHEKKCGKVQQGGTDILLYGSLVDQYNFEASGKDDTRLGRWVSMVLQEADGIRTRVVCGYNPCHIKKKATRSSYQQQMRYFIMKENNRTCPRTRFKNDLLAQLRKWREQGDWLIVCIEVNEDIYRKRIGKALTMSEDLQMIEAVGNYTGKKIGATFLEKQSQLMASG